MSHELTRLAGAALRAAVDPFVGQDATPQVCARIKKAFVQIMRENGVDWTRDAWQIRVSFIGGTQPNVDIPPHLLKRAVH